MRNFYHFILIIIFCLFAFSCKKKEDETLPEKVTGLQPNNAAVDILITNALSWSAADRASSYNVYFGTNAVEVSNATSSSAEFAGNVTETSFCNISLFSYTTTYYWRVDSVNDTGVTKGDLLFFTTEPVPNTPPLQVTVPNPNNGAINVSLDTALTWASAARASSYDIYFGNDSAEVDNATTASAFYKGNYVELQYVQESDLLSNTTYYWRIDSVNSYGTTKGMVWSFTTAPVPIADFTAQPVIGSAPLIVNFTNTSRGLINLYEWDFDNDGVVDSFGANQVYMYHEVGTYSVRLRTTGPFGTDEIVKEDLIEVLDFNIVTKLLPPCGKSTEYSVILRAEFGITPYSWAITDGALPSGLELDEETGTISGTPAETGNFTFTVTVYDSASGVEDCTYTLLSKLWLNAGNVSETGEVSGKPAVIEDNNGYVYCVWADGTIGERVINFKFYNGLEWSDFETLSNGFGDSKSPDIAVDSNNYIHVVWANDELGTYFIYYSFYNGSFWSQPIEVSRDGDADIPKIAVDSEDTLHLVWQQSSVQGEFIYYSNNDSWDWSEPDIISQASASSPDIAIDSTNTVHVVWSALNSGLNDIYISTYSGVWSQIQPVNVSPNNSYKPKIAVASNDEIYVSWEELIEINREIFFRKLESPVINISFNSGRSLSSDIVAVENGYVWISWEDNTSGTDDILIAVTDGTYFSPVLKVVNANGVPGNSSLTACRGGNIVLCYTDDLGEEGRDVFSSIYNSYAVWNTPVDITANLRASGSPSMRADDSGNIHLVYQDYAPGNADVFYTKYDGVLWTSSLNLSNNSGSSFSPRVNTDGLGYIHVTWHDNTVRAWQVYHTYYDGVNWSVPLVVSTTSNSFSGCRLCVDDEGTFFATWQETVSGSGEIMVSMWSETGGWSQPVNVSNSGSDSSLPLIVSGNSQVYVFWNDNATGEYDIYYSMFDGVSWS
ncbi:MAG: putative Ig domain-containing protein, partial [Planctomycetota bacterium]